MKKFQLMRCLVALMALLALSGQGGAQPAQGQAGPGGDRSANRPGDAAQKRLAREQRRHDLRDSLQVQRQRQDGADPLAPANRHLSPQERAEMRQQLKQQNR